MKEGEGAPEAPLLTDLLREVLGSNLRVVGFHPILHREEYSILVAHMVDPTPPVVIKLAGPRAALAAPFDRTMTINRLLREKTATPTPQVLAADVSYRDWPWRRSPIGHIPTSRFVKVVTDGVRSL